ncbi:MAG: putative metalloprotease CJM1_0395 family protein [bacterium]
MRIENRISPAYFEYAKLPTSDKSRPGVGSESPAPSVAEENKGEQSAENFSAAQPDEENKDRYISAAEQFAEESNSERSTLSPPESSSDSVVAEDSDRSDEPPASGVRREDVDESGETSSEPSDSGDEKDSESVDGLSEEERREVQELRQTDQKVRRHEQAHVAAGGQHVRSGPRYDYKYGPDGRRYAVGGSVDIDTSKESEPEKTEKKMQQVKAAAMAPAEPSPSDYKVAQQAAQKEMKARMEMAKEEREGEDEENTGEEAVKAGGSIREEKTTGAGEAAGREDANREGNNIAGDFAEGGINVADIFSETSRPSTGAIFNAVA